MLKRFAPLVPLALSAFLVACAGYQPAPQVAEKPQQTISQQVADDNDDDGIDPLPDFAQDQPYELPSFADSILAHGLSLIGTRYRFGGTSANTGFDCSGFIGFLFKEEAGMDLPRSTREMINLDAPLVSRNDLQPGDLLFFSTRGRGRVSHAGIYLGDDQFIHSSSSKSGGVRVDSLDDKYWSRTFIEAKRALAMASVTPIETRNPLHP